MVSAVKWEAAPSVTANIITTALNSMANNTISAASSVVDNSANLDTYAWIELNATFGTAPSDSSPTVDVYMATSPDGTNYETAPLTGAADQGHMYVGSFPISKVTSAQRLVIPVQLPPMKVKLYLDNQTGQAMSATGNTLDIAVDNLEAQ